MSDAEIVRAFIERINARDVAGLSACLSEDHRFIDSLGTVFIRRETLRQGWAGYFQLVADYQITITEMAASNASLLLVGTAAGRSAGTAWLVPAAWRAVVRAGQVAEWQVYADNEPLRASLRSPDCGSSAGCLTRACSRQARPSELRAGGERR